MKPYNYSPEVVILNVVQNLLNFVRKNYKDCQAANTPNESYLYKVFKGNSFERYDYYEQAVSILITSKNDQRHFVVDFAFNNQLNKVPSAFISLGQETPMANGLSMDEGYDNSFNHDDTTNQPVYTRGFSTQYDLYLYSDQYLEAIILYQLTRSLVISFTPYIEVMGLRNLSTLGKDLEKYPDFMPKGLFLRALSFRFFYETQAPTSEKYSSYQDIIFKNVVNIK